ncbi:DUF6779 domain-containing protein, partial [Actinosynnema sp.]
MTGRAPSRDDEQQEHGRGSARLLLVAALAFALVAAAVLVLSDNARWLRLAVVSALWAALVGAFLAARYRRQVADREDEVADLQNVYELELEREVAARREFELELETEAHRKAREDAKDDLDALRGELRALRENLEALLGGEVLVERVALRAEATRMRSLGDQSRLDQSRLVSAMNEHRVITSGKAKKDDQPSVVDLDPAEQTELIERVTDAQPARRVEPARREA